MAAAELVLRMPTAIDPLLEDSFLQGFSGPLSQKSDENPRMRVIPHSKFPPKCAHAPILVAFL